MTNRHKDFPVFDCDSHVVEPAEIWNEYVPKGKREYVKSHFYNPLVEHIKVLNGRTYPYSSAGAISATSSWVPGRSTEQNRINIGTLTPGTPEYDEKGGKVAATWNPSARLNDMDVMGIDQVPATGARRPGSDGSNLGVQRLGLRLLPGRHLSHFPLWRFGASGRRGSYR